MLVSEIFQPVPSIDEVLDEDFKSTRDRVLGAAVAGSMAMGIAGVGHAMNQARADQQNQSSVTYELPDPDSDAESGDAHHSKMSQDEKFLALTIWGEARSGGKNAMRAVAHVILNRVNSARSFGNDVREVVRDRKAFSCWNKSDPNRELMMNIGQLDKDSEDYKMWQTAKKIAKRVVRGHDKDPTNGALFYHTDNVKPTWSAGQQVIADIGGHLFYKTDAKAKSKEA
jgi:N-acetylmuramoyl-L-alanine amidase